MITIDNPSILRFNGYEDKLDLLKEKLTYRDLKEAFELKRFKDGSRWYLADHSMEEYQDEVNRIHSQIKKCILFKDEQGYWTYSGLRDTLSRDFIDVILNNIEYPEPSPIAWISDPKKLRPYQEEALAKLLSAKHAAVSMGTGLGKGTLILNLIQRLGLKTLVMAPSISIAEQIYADCVQYLGKHRVGRYFSNKKEASKLIVIGVAAGLTRIERDDYSYDILAQSKVFIADESHMCPAKSLAEVCFGLAKDAPYRFFFSGTQIRNDGSDLLLDAIIGPIVYEMTVAEGIDQKWLAKPIFRTIATTTDLAYSSKDVNKLTRKHLFYNPRVNKISADIANQAWKHKQKTTLIIVEEIEQFMYLLPYFKYQAKFAHAPLDQKRKKLLPKEYHTKNNAVLVKEFNEGKFPILVGTSCVSTGTDFQTVENIIYIRAGTSEIEVRQGVGRGTRIPTYGDKEDFFFWDFDVTNEPSLHRHSELRKDIYREIYPSLEEVRWPNE